MRDQTYTRFYKKLGDAKTKTRAQTKSATELRDISKIIDNPKRHALEVKNIKKVPMITDIELQGLPNPPVTEDGLIDQEALLESIEKIREDMAKDLGIKELPKDIPITYFYNHSLKELRSLTQYPEILEEAKEELYYNASK